MSKIIYYPHYSPARFELRALLLFYNDISTIVPEEDQRFVEQRQHLQELESAAGKAPISFVDPSYGLFTWENDEETFQSFIRLAEQTSRKISPDLRSALSKKQNHLDLSQSELPLNDRLQSEGWTYVARQKIREETLDKLMEMGVALPTPVLRSKETNQIIESQPILLPSDLADFALSRLARDIASRDFNIPVTLEDSPHYASLYRGGIHLPEKRHFLVSSLIWAAIPDCLADLSSDDYWKLREEYSDVRENLNNLIAETMITHDLDGSTDFDEFAQRTKSVVEDLRAEIESAANQTPRPWVQNLRQVFLDTSFAIVTACVSSGLGNFFGSIANVGINRLSDRASKYFTTRSEDLTSQIGHVRARIVQKAQVPEYRVPSYMI